MTALNAFVGSAAHLVTDHAHFAPDDDLAKFFAPKVATLPHFGAAVAVSGPAGIVHVMGAVIHTQARDLDELMAHRAIEIVGATAAAMPVPARIVFAGLSPAHGPSVWALFDGEFKRIPHNQAYLAPAVEGWEPVPDDDAPAFEAAMADLACRQRLKYPVGGCVSLTTIRAAGVIEQKIIHRWPDKIGDSIVPLN